jgi:hypothetical protein
MIVIIVILLLYLLWVILHMVSIVVIIIILISSNTVVGNKNSFMLYIFPCSSHVNFILRLQSTSPHVFEENIILGLPQMTRIESWSTVIHHHGYPHL